MLPGSLHSAAISVLSGYRGHGINIQNAFPLSGGSINHAYRIETNAGPFFMKYNRSSKYPGMFEKEARGLELLRAAAGIRVPEVLGQGDDGTYSFIVLEYIDPAPRTQQFWEDFGRKLATLHQNHADKFGLDHDNYIGSLEQYNDRQDSWTDFFREQRLGVQIEMAGRSGILPSRLENAFKSLFARLDEIFPDEPPSLIHGDLWSGNYMVDESGHACIIDPAVYYGSREMDIGMSRLFGVFGSNFYDAYNEAWPMKPGWRERIEVCNLYPLMVHVNLFGSGYLGSVESILSRF